MEFNEVKDEFVIFCCIEIVDVEFEVEDEDFI